MTNLKRAAALAILLVSVAVLPSCKTTGAPDGGVNTPTTPIGTVLVDCGKTIGGPVAGAEIPKIVTALTSDNVSAGIQACISDLTTATVLETSAFAFVACVVRNELGRAQRDSLFGSAPASKRAAAADNWIRANGVSFVDAGAGGN